MLPVLEVSRLAGLAEAVCEGCRQRRYFRRAGRVSLLWRGLSLMAYAWTWLCVVADQRDRDRLALEAAGIRRIGGQRAW